MTIERKSAAAAPVISKAVMPFQVKEIDADSRTFAGLAATWDLDLGGDIIHRGAFKRTLGHWRKSKKVLPLIDAHNYGSVRAVIGKLLDAEETAEGLETEFEVIDGHDGDEVMRRLKGGYVDSLSIGYRPVKWDYEDDSDVGFIRHLKELKLDEVSLVIFPMNPNAAVDAASVKALLRAIDEDPALRQEVEAFFTKRPRKAAPAAVEPLIDELTDEEIARLESRMREIRTREIRHLG